MLEGSSNLCSVLCFIIKQKIAGLASGPWLTPWILDNSNSPSLQTVPAKEEADPVHFCSKKQIAMFGLHYARQEPNPTF